MTENRYAETEGKMPSWIGFISVKYICGPAISLGGNRFRVDRDHPTWRNPRRRAIITLCAEAPSDDRFKETVQEIEVILQ